MADGTGIQWTEATWNPVTGCSKVSAGCKFCYAEKMAERLQAMGAPGYAAGFDVTLQPAMLERPLRWRRPRLIFVNSMSDLFHEKVPEDYVARVFDVMARAPQHTFQVLTKRAARLAELAPRLPWPDNVWMGVSVEDQRAANERIPFLLSVPAAVRFLSMEPLLGPVKLDHLDVEAHPAASRLGPLGGYFVNALTGENRDMGRPCPDVPRLDWLIVGGESGPGARPMAVEWAADILRQAQAADVPVFVKQLGAVWARQNGARHQKGGEPVEWPEHLRVRAMPARRTT